MRRSIDGKQQSKDSKGMENPTKIKEVKSFLGFANFY